MIQQQSVLLQILCLQRTVYFAHHRIHPNNFAINQVKYNGKSLSIDFSNSQLFCLPEVKAPLNLVLAPGLNLPSTSKKPSNAHSSVNSILNDGLWSFSISLSPGK